MCKFPEHARLADSRFSDECDYLTAARVCLRGHAPQHVHLVRTTDELGQPARSTGLYTHARVDAVELADLHRAINAFYSDPLEGAYSDETFGQGEAIA